MKTLQGIRQLLAVHVPIELKFIITQDSVMGNFEIGEWLFRNGLQRVKQIVIVGQVSPKIMLEINGKKQEFSTNKGLFQKETKIDISRYIEDGSNTIIFYGFDDRNKYRYPGQ